MGRRGPPKNPTKLTVLRGNPGKRPLNPREPQPVVGLPTPPRNLSTEARAEWKRVIAAIGATGVITRADRAALIVYCQAWADYVTVYKAVEDQGRTFVTPQGYVAKNPMVTIMNEARAAVLKFAQEFGLTPAARTRVQAPDKVAAEDPFEKFLKGASSA